MNVEGSKKGIKRRARNPLRQFHTAEIQCKYQIVTLCEITNVLQPRASSKANRI